MQYRWVTASVTQVSSGDEHQDTGLNVYCLQSPSISLLYTLIFHMDDN